MFQFIFKFVIFLRVCMSIVFNDEFFFIAIALDSADFFCQVVFCSMSKFFTSSVFLSFRVIIMIAVTKEALFHIISSDYYVVYVHTIIQWRIVQENKTHWYDFLLTLLAIFKPFCGNPSTDSISWCLYDVFGEKKHTWACYN